MALETYRAPRPAPARSGLSAVPYMPGLDGLRALAVIAVMIYHADTRWLSGGFLGVEVFFVISGYLITLLLMAEREQTGRVDLIAFWSRRARRLLPALFLLLFLVLTYSMMFKSSVLGKLRGDLIAALAYVTNWYQIWVGQGYTATNDFVPLRHLWSLAVEEQFYLIWPIAMLLMMRGGTRRIAFTARWLVIAALGVSVLMALLHHSGSIGECDVTPEAYWNVADRCISKSDTLYLSTITRSTGLLFGAAMAMLWRPRAIMRSRLRDASRMLDLLGLAGLGALFALCWFLHVVTVHGADPWLFRGGLLLTDLATVLVIAAITHRHTLTSRVMALPPLVWAGTRSYGLYLYHWPIYQVIRKIAGIPLTLQQFVVAILVTVVVSEFSYRFVEMPIRRREFARWWESLRRRPNPAPRQIMTATVVVSLLLLAVGVIRLGLAELRPNEVEATLDQGEQATIDLAAMMSGTTSPDDAQETAPPTTVPATAPDSTALAESTTTSTSTTTTTTTLPSGPINYLAIGDSVMLGAAGVLTDLGYTVDAVKSRQMIEMVPVMEQLRERGVFDNVVVVHLGTNGPFEKETLDAFLAPLSQVPNVIILNVFANRPWTAHNNQLLDDRDVAGDNIWLVDWYDLAPKCPGSCFAADGIHLNAQGQRYYASVIGDITGIG